jgi:predicted N-acetyltransferase YhbS
MTEIRDEIASDIPAREVLLDRCLGERRTAKSSERLREGRLPAQGLALTAERDGVVVGTVRLWHVEAGGVPALLLGPLAVAPDLQGEGLGKAIMREAIWRAACRGHGAILLVGDAAYYERFGFSADLTRDLAMPGPVERERFLGLGLRAGALLGATGILCATGALDEAVPAIAPRRLIPPSRARHRAVIGSRFPCRGSAIAIDGALLRPYQPRFARDHPPRSSQE